MKDRALIVLFVVSLLFGPASVHSLTTVLNTGAVHPMVALAIGVVFGWITIPLSLFLGAL